MSDGWTTGMPTSDVDRIPERGHSSIETLADDLMHWTDLHCTALDAEADARIAYDEAYGDELTLQHRNGVQMAIIKEMTRAQCKDELKTLARAEAAVKRTRAKVQEVNARLTAAQSQAKYSGLADGGSR